MSINEKTREDEENDEIDIWISHFMARNIKNRRDHRRALRLKEILEGHSYKVGMKKTYVSNEGEQVNSRLKGCSCVVALLSEDYIKYTEKAQELLKNKVDNVFPVVLDDKTLSIKEWKKSKITYFIPPYRCIELTASEEEDAQGFQKQVDILLEFLAEHFKKVSTVSSNDDEVRDDQLNIKRSSTRHTRSLKKRSSTTKKDPVEAKPFDGERRSTKQKSAIVVGETPKKEWEYDVFLSHDWGPDPDFANHEKAKEFAMKLESKGYKVWIDEKDLTSDISKDIMEGIHNSAIVIFLVTKNFLQRNKDTTTNVSKEVAYTARIKKEVIPVVMEKESNQSNQWNYTDLGFHYGRMKYFDLSQGDKREFKRICERIDEVKKKNGFLVKPES